MIRRNWLFRDEFELSNELNDLLNSFGGAPSTEYIFTFHLPRLFPSVYLSQEAIN
jgi:hypothetical protein